jgi:preprotein translocase subunit YajC
MLTSLLLFAQDAKDGADGGGGFNPNSFLLPLAVIFMLFFFLIVLPSQRRQKREQENLLANLKKNDEVVTTSGIIGIVANIKEGGNEVTLKIDDNARIRVLKTSIAQILKKDEPPASAPAPTNTNIKPAT